MFRDSLGESNSRLGTHEEEEILKEEFRAIRRKMGKYEEEFLNSGIYGSDTRYYRVRSKF